MDISKIIYIILASEPSETDPVVEMNDLKMYRPHKVQELLNHGSPIEPEPDEFKALKDLDEQKHFKLESDVARRHRSFNR